MLFSEEAGIIQTAYLNWNEQRCIKITNRHIAGAAGKTATLGDLSDHCWVKVPRAEFFFAIFRSGLPIEDINRILIRTVVAYERRGWPWM